MATDLEINSAKSIIRNIGSKITRRHGRSHENTMLENANRSRALNGLCGHCRYLTIEHVKTYTGAISISLKCEVNLSPLELYQRTEVGETPHCSGFKER